MKRVRFSVLLLATLAVSGTARAQEFHQPPLLDPQARAQHDGHHHAPGDQYLLVAEQAAKRVEREAMTAEGDDAVRQLRRAATLDEALAFVESRAALADPLRDRLLFELARHARSVGATEQDALALDRIAALETDVTYPVIGCRTAVPTPVFNFMQEAKEAAFVIRHDIARAEISGELASGSLDWLGGVLSLAPDAPRLHGAISALDGATPMQRAEISRQVAELPGALNTAASELLARTVMLDGTAPAAGVFARLDGATALRLVQSADNLSADARGELLRAALAHPSTASAATQALGRPAGESLAEYLARAGADAAMVMSADTSDATVNGLRALLVEGTEPIAVLRHAALALRFNASPAASDALRAAAASSSLDATLRTNIERWLAE